MSNTKRINYNIPVDLAPQIQLFADQDGQNVRYWLRKALEKAINERLNNQQSA